MLESGAFLARTRDEGSQVPIMGDKAPTSSAEAQRKRAADGDAIGAAPRDVPCHKLRRGMSQT